jgi:hypothetical protein
MDAIQVFIVIDLVVLVGSGTLAVLVFRKIQQQRRRAQLFD